MKTTKTATKTVSHASPAVTVTGAGATEATSPALTFLQPPPADAKIPAPPPGGNPPNGANYTAFLPRAIELAALSNAVADLQKCTNFVQLFGVTALPYAQVLQAFAVGNQWTTMRNETAAWDAFCQTQEGICWKTIRAMMDRLRPAFDLAVMGDATVASTMPGLAELLGAKKAIAQKAVATKKANRAAIARGEAPVHGAVGKRRLKAAAKALMPAAKAAVGTAAPPPTADGGVAQTPAVAASQVVAPAAAAPAVVAAGASGH